MSKTILNSFNKLVLDNFSEILEKYGFRLLRNKIEDCFCEIIYVKNTLYISFKANIHPRDYPPYFNILLGEGTLEWPDYDWNHVTLWHFAKYFDEKSCIDEYSLEDLSKLEDSLEKAKKDLIRYGQDFLNGDLDSFYKIRKNVNKKRELYKIYTPNKKGVYAKKYDEISAEMKDKYTKIPKRKYGVTY